MIWRSIIFGSVLYLSVNCATKRAWKHEILSITGTTTDENILNVNVQTDRLSFDESSISGTFDVKIDVGEGATFELLLYHSVSGREDDYQETPYKVPKDTFKHFIDKYYMDFTYPNLHDCSNLPKFEEEFVKWPKGVYTLNNCMLTGDGLPYALPSGYYKVWIKVIAQAELNLIIITKVTPKVI